MTKFLANTALAVAALAVNLGSYWYVFGLWPKSWFAFVGFGIATIVLIFLRMMVEQEK